MAYDKTSQWKGLGALHDICETRNGKIFDSVDTVALWRHQEHSASTNQKMESSVIFKVLYFPPILRIFAWNFAWAIFVISSMKYIMRKNVHLRTLYFFRASQFLRSAVLHYLNFCLMFFPLLLYVSNGAPEASKFSILSKAFQNYASLGPFQNKWPKYELNI